MTHTSIGGPDEPPEAAGRRVGVAWRELRRLAAAQAIRRQLYGFETPLDQGQGDALEYVVNQGPCRMGDLAKFMRVDPSSVTRAVERLETAGLVSPYRRPARRTCRASLVHRRWARCLSRWA